ncbi:restriction endonuclease subunit S [Sphingomonas parapaucimobilis]|nr:restriction endonuclease subunit S [Sphingomonas parapaucimobilis]
MIESIRGGVSVLCDDGVCDETNPGVLTLSAVTSGEFRPEACKRALTAEIGRLSVPVRAGTILITRKNTPELVGRVALVRKDYPHLHLPDLIWEICPKAGVDARWLYAFLSSPSFRAIVEQGAAGSSQSMVGISRDVVLTARAQLPSLDEQQRISAVLDMWDDAISSADRLIIARSLLLAGHAKEVFFPAFSGQPPQGWTTFRLGALFDERDERGGSGRLLSVTGDRGIIDRDDLGRKDTSNNDKSTYKRVGVGDIAYNTMRMWQGVSALSTLDGLVSPAYTVVAPRANIDGVYAAFLFKQQHMIDRFWRYSQGLVDDTLNLKYPHFSEVIVNIPTLAQQRRDVNALALFSKATSAAVELAALLRRQKRGLMQKLLTGEWCVPVTGDALAPGGPAADRLEAAE